ncbi:MAG TPA: 50S ribosomal protein L11 methyltransferase [Flavisolibacter sp.]|nr:50S ribosomal protein L11 methyltransferase [Flavisolibacter sp.]
MKHIQIEIIANDYQQEELIALFDDYDATGFEQTDEKLIAYFNTDDFAKDEIEKLLEGYSYQQTEVEERNWNEEWERNFQPVVVDDFVAVRAHFHAPIKDVQHEIVITPKMSFGTGHHATTYMMMQQMRGIDFGGKEVFDFGTGTGILAILAEKLGAREIFAIDVDDWSIDNAKENFERNDCHNIHVSLSSQLPAAQFDVILANINRNVILDYMPQLVKTLRKNSQVLFSGLLVADEHDIAASAEGNGLSFVTKSERLGWVSLLFVNAS